VKCTTYIIEYSNYLIQTYLLKNYKTKNAIDVDKIKYACSMNKGKVVIENVLGSLKNQWPILKLFNSKVDKATRVTITCYVLHNFCEMWKEPKLRLANLTSRRENILGFNNHMLFVRKDGKVTKVEGKTLRLAL
jgi:hypothetical protein